MKYTAALSLLAIVATAVAAPADIEARTGGGGGQPPSNCNNNGKQVCCSGILTCLVQAIGSPCSNEAYCCNTEVPVGTLVNIALLNCVKLL